MVKEDLQMNLIETNPTCYYERLENLIEEMSLINEDLAKIMKDEQQRYNNLFN